MTNEHCDSSLSLVGFHTLQEGIKVMNHKYLQLLDNKNYLLKCVCTCYDALLGKEEEVVELTHKLEVRYWRAPSWLLWNRSISWMRLSWSYGECNVHQLQILYRLL